jgi:uncharacterized protein DUF6412
VRGVYGAVLLLVAQVLLVPDAGLGPALAVAAAVTLVAAASLVLAAAGRVAPAPQARVRTALRDRRRRTAFLPQRDPDADGRPRPRAPGRRLRTAAA